MLPDLEVGGMSGADAGVFSPIVLPCGRSIQNRLVKVAMYEHLAKLFGGPPNTYHFSLYSTWASYGWGMIVTGNVQVSSTHLTLGRDLVLPNELTEESLLSFKRLSSCMKGVQDQAAGYASDYSSPLTIMQLNHSGRQSTNILGGRYPFQLPLAPSAIRVGVKSSSLMSNLINSAFFQIPRPMTIEDIDDVVNSFIKGAKVALDSGFDGVQLHVAHGYLLAQFLSPKSNKRTDDYSADTTNDLRLLRRIISSIREVVPGTFVLGLKLNAGDYITPIIPEEDAGVSSNFKAVDEKEDHCLRHLRTIAQWGGVDFIEISGGDYENPAFMSSENYSSNSPRQAFFARFSRMAIETLESVPRDPSSPPLPLILLTGGLRTPKLLHTVLKSRHADLLGIGRGSVLCPNLPQVLEERQKDLVKWNDLSFAPEPNLDPPRCLNYWPLSWIWIFIPKIELIGAGVGMAWYLVMMRRLSLAALNRSGKARRVKPDDLLPDYTIGGIGGVFWMWAWICAPDIHWSLYTCIAAILTSVATWFYRA